MLKAARRIFTKEVIKVRLQLELLPADGKKHVCLPLHYNKAVQGLIYTMIRSELPNLHNEGHNVGGRIIRLFVFSRLLGKVIAIKNGNIILQAPVAIKVASPDNKFIEVLAENLLYAPIVNLAGVDMHLSTLSVQPQADFSSGYVKFKAISPVTVYSTLATPDGRKKTYYYHPAEKEFQQQIKANLARKAEILGFSPEYAYNMNVKSIRVKNSDQKIIFFKDTVIKGWFGIYEFEGDPRVLNIAFDCGIGAKNSQGFGMLECI